MESAAQAHFFDVISRICPLSQSAGEALRSILYYRELPRGYPLLDIWQIDKEFHFIHEGSGRVYYLREALDITDYIAMDGQFLGGLESLITQKPSHKGMELTENSALLSFRMQDFEQLCAQHHEIERLGRLMATFAFLEAQKRIESIRFLSAAERYRELEKKYPGISNRIPLRHLASFIGTTQVSLSRIRKGIQ